MLKEKKNFVINTIWSFLSQSSTVIISLIANIILARLLSPLEFGKAGIVMFFITVLNVLADGGLGGALVRTKNLASEDYSTVFLFNLAISFVLFVSLFAFSGIIASYYNEVELIPLVRVSSTIILINSFNLIQNARIYREMKFKVNFYINLSAVILSSIIGVFMASKGFGVWALVILNISLVFFKTVFMWISEGGIGKLIFNVNSFKSLYKFGVFVTLISFLNNAFDNIYQLLLGKFFSIGQVGYFYQAKKIQGPPFLILNTLSLGIVYSHLARFQDNKLSFQKEYLHVFSFFSVILAAVASIIFLLSSDFVHLLLGKVWLESVIYVRLLTIASFFLILKIFCQNICKVFDRTEKIFIWEMVAILMQVATIIVGIVTKSIFITLSGAIVSNLAAYIINSVYSWKLLELRSHGEMKLILKIVMAAIGGVLATSVVNLITINMIGHIILAPLVFALFYAAVLRIFGIFDYRRFFYMYKSLKH